MQLVALTEDQVMVVELPRVMDAAAKVSVGAGGGAVTVRLTELACDVPSALLHVSEYVSVPPTVGVNVKLPLAPNVPLQLPDAVQLAAFGEDQEIVDDWPRSMALVLSVSDGAAGATSVKLTEFDADKPAAFTHVSV